MILLYSFPQKSPHFFKVSPAQQLQWSPFSPIVPPALPPTAFNFILTVVLVYGSFIRVSWLDPSWHESLITSGSFLPAHFSLKYLTLFYPNPFSPSKEMICFLCDPENNLLGMISIPFFSPFYKHICFFTHDPFHCLVYSFYLRPALLPVGI